MVSALWGENLRIRKSSLGPVILFSSRLIVEPRVQVLCLDFCSQSAHSQTSSGFVFLFHLASKQKKKVLQREGERGNRAKLKSCFCSSGHWAASGVFISVPARVTLCFLMKFPPVKIPSENFTVPSTSYLVCLFCLEGFKLGWFL